MGQANTETTETNENTNYTIEDPLCPSKKPEIGQDASQDFQYSIAGKLSYEPSK